MRIFLIMTALLFGFVPLAHCWDGGTTDTVETRYASGQLKEKFQRFTYNGNERTYLYGFYRSWYENGQKKSEGQYIKDLEEGTWIYWDSTGRRVREVSYHNGLKHGMEIEWNGNGTMNKRLSFKNNTLHGVSTWFKSSNNIIDQFNNEYYTIEKNCFYLNGEELLPFSDSTVRANLILLDDRSKQYYSDELKLWVEWDRNNSKFWVGKEVEDKKNGQWILWSTTGDMLEAEYYKDGVKLD